MKKEVCFATGVTRNYTSQLAVLLLGLQKYSPNMANAIIVYHDGIDQEMQKQLADIGQPVRFVEYTSMQADGLAEELIANYSLVTFSRYECFNLLSEFHTVMWFDVDILIQNDISGLYKYGKQSGIASSYSSELFNISNFIQPIPDYEMYCPLYNAGMLVLRDNLPRYGEMADWCYAKTKELAPFLRWADQSILNLMIQEFKLDVEEIDIARYVCHPDRPDTSYADIVHAYGIKKFWNNMERDLQFPAWRNFLLEWGKRVAISLCRTPRVSVVMSVYRRLNYLDESITSILAQTMIDLELIIVVEYSDAQDAVVNYLSRFDDPRLIVIRNTHHLGFAASLNVGLDRARGKYIARFDDDDYSVLERLQVQADFLDNHPEIDIVGTYMQCFDGDTQVINSVSTDDAEIRIRLLSETQIYHPTAMLKVETMRKYNLRYDPAFFTEDYALWARAVEYCKFANIPQILVRYRVSKTNMTTNNDAKVHKSHIEIMRFQLKKYLDIDAKYDELMLLQRRTKIISRILKSKSALAMRHEFLKRIYNANKRRKFYDQQLIKSVYAFPDFQKDFKLNKYRSFISPYKSKILRGKLALSTLFPKVFKQLNKIFGARSRLKNYFKSAIEESARKQNGYLISTLQTQMKKDFEELQRQIEDIHTQSAWGQQDILSLVKASLPVQPRFRCQAQAPRACDRSDRIFPVAPVRAHVRSPRFIRACEALFPGKERLSFLDLGLPAGGMAWDAILRGHIAVGLEGNARALSRQGPEWRLIPDSLFPCDISKPFTIAGDGEPWIFDVIFAWNVLDSMTQDGITALFASLSRHMDHHSLFFCLASQKNGAGTITDQFSPQDIRLHSWLQKFIHEQGFCIIEPDSVMLREFRELMEGGWHSFNTSLEAQDKSCQFFVIKTTG